jgi:hypothetical protein
MYTAGGILLFAGIAYILSSFTLVPIFRRDDRLTSSSSSMSSGMDAAGGLTNPGMGRWDGYEYDYRF